MKQPAHESSPERLEHLEPRPFGREALGEARAVTRGPLGQADIFRLRWRGQDWIIKDFAGRGWANRLLGTRLIKREAMAYQHLSHAARFKQAERNTVAAGIPPRWFVVDRHAFATEFVEGKKLNQLETIDLREQALRSLETHLAHWHASGIAHLDLRGLGNIRVLENGDVCVFDWASCLIWNPKRPDWKARRAREVDASALRKWRVRLLPDSVSEVEHQQWLKDKQRRRFWLFNLRHRLQDPRRPKD